MRLLYLLLACSLTAPLYAQSSDSAKVAYSQEECRLTTEEVKRFLCYVTRANVEEKTLIKLGFWPVTSERTERPSFRIGVNTQASIEQKISPSFSVLTGADLGLNYTSFSRFTIPFDGLGNGQLTDIDKIFRLALYAKVGVRYYYAMAKRIQQGKSANNFSGNYIGLQLTKSISVHSLSHYYRTPSGESLYTINDDLTRYYDRPFLGLHWGMQRRLGRRGFFDINAGPEVNFYQANSQLQFYKRKNQPSLSLQVNAVVGLGW